MRPYKLLIVVAALLPFLLHFGYTYSKVQSHRATEPGQPTEQYGLLQSIMLGNKRFASDVAAHPHMHARYTRQIAKEQHPHAVVIACSDSRVSPEIVFDEGLGDLFVIRTAGNMISELELASIEYAVEHLQVNLIIVMGHENCGAVKAMVESTPPSGHIKSLIDSLSNETEIAAIPFNAPNRLEKCIKANVIHNLNTIKVESELVAEKMKTGKMQLVGTYYDLDERLVTMIEQK